MNKLILDPGHEIYQIFYTSKSCMILMLLLIATFVVLKKMLKKHHMWYFLSFLFLQLEYSPIVIFNAKSFAQMSEYSLITQIEFA